MIQRSSIKTEHFDFKLEIEKGNWVNPFTDPKFFQCKEIYRKPVAIDLVI